VAVDGHGFRYAPAVALLFAPFALLPLEVAAFVFVLLKMLALAHVAIVLARRVGRPELRWKFVGAAVAITGGYLVEEFRNGNVHFFVVWMMVVALDAAERRRVLMPAGLLAIAIAAKITPLVLLGYLAWRRHLSVVAATATGLAMLWMAPAIVWGVDENAHLQTGFLKYTALKMEEPLTARNFSLRGWLLLYSPFGMSSHAATVVWAAVLALVSVAMMWLVRPGPRSAASRAVDLALIITAMPLLSPHTQRIHMAAQAVPAALLWWLVKFEPHVRFRRLGIAALLVTALVSTVMPLVLGSREFMLRYMDLSPYPIATLALFATLMAIGVGLKRSESPADIQNL
jgi:alpha-1,2-mannosyltransferase